MICNLLLFVSVVKLYFNLFSKSFCMFRFDKVKIPKFNYLCKYLIVISFTLYI
ncbi:hypothetical protein VPHK460_0132 [Vibrio phage K460]